MSIHLPALISYLQGLRENNNKAWFVMNKPAYDILRPEFIALVAEVVNGLAKHDPLIADVDPRKALFRIYRDVRFSNDKTPYKTYLSAALAEPGAKKSGPMYYLQIDADGTLHLAAGCYLPERDALARFRRHVVDDYAGLTRVLGAKRFMKSFGDLDRSDRLARLPKGFDPTDRAVQKAAGLVRLKSFVVSTNVDVSSPARARDSSGLASTIVDTFAAAAPLNDWLRAAPRAVSPDQADQVDATVSERPAPTRTKRATKRPAS